MQNHYEITSKTQFWTQHVRNGTNNWNMDMSWTPKAPSENETFPENKKHAFFFLKTIRSDWRRNPWEKQRFFQRQQNQFLKTKSYCSLYKSRNTQGNIYGKYLGNIYGIYQEYRGAGGLGRFLIYGVNRRQVLIGKPHLYLFFPDFTPSLFY